MNMLINEAIKITQELEGVIFIGAVATHMHTTSTRDSQDLDFVLAAPIADEDLISKGYYKSITGKQPWFSPRGVKIDIYNGDIPGVSFDNMIKYSKEFTVKGNSIRVIGLEALIVAKHTAARDQDIDDLRNMAKNRLKDIDWNTIKSITKDDYKTSLIKSDMQALARS
jgi:predicted nucleotidyltransferase